MLDQKRSQRLRAIGLYPSLMAFWVLYHSVDIVHENPRYIQELTCRMYPEIAERIPCTPNAVESTLRRMCKKYAEGHHALLREYLPADVGRCPRPKELLSAWLFMMEEADPKQAAMNDFSFES